MSNTMATMIFLSITLDSMLFIGLLISGIGFAKTTFDKITKLEKRIEELEAVSDKTKNNAKS